MEPTALMRIMRVDDLEVFTFDDGPYLWDRWEIKDRPLLAHEDKYWNLESVIKDIERAKNIINKALGQEAMFIPRYVATAFITLLRRMVPFEPTWVPAFELQGKTILTDCSYYILKLDEELEKWTLIHWEVGAERKFIWIDFDAFSDRRTGHYGDISMMSLYNLIDQQIYQKIAQRFSKGTDL